MVLESVSVETKEEFRKEVEGGFLQDETRQATPLMQATVAKSLNGLELSDTSRHSPLLV